MKEIKAPKRLIYPVPMVTLSFDDARKDFYTVAVPIMEKYGIRGVCHVITGWVDGTGVAFAPTTGGTADLQGPMSVADVQDCFARGHEMSAHGHEHSNTQEDIALCVQKMNSWGVPVYGFATPGSVLTLANHWIRKKWYSDLGLLYARSNNIIGRVGAKNNVPYAPTHPFYNYFLPSIGIYSTTDVSYIQSMINAAITDKKWCILMLHSILNPDDAGYGADSWFWSADNFEQLCEWLADLQTQNQIRIVTFKDGIQLINGLPLLD